MNKVLQVYATVVCVIAIITVIITTANLVSGYIDQKDPLHSGYLDDNLSSFAYFKLETMRGITKDQAYIPTDDEIRTMYEEALDEKLEKATHRIQRDLIVNRLIFIFGVFLFIVHWIIMRRAMRLSPKS